MHEYGNPEAFLLLVPVWGLLAQRWLTGHNKLAVPGFTVLKRRYTLRLLLAWLPAALQLVGLSLLVFALARPRIAHRSVSVESEGLDIVLAVDTSGSMRAEDFQKSGMPVNRLTVAKGVMAEFVEGRPHDRIGVVVFGEEAFTQVPLTLDHQTLVDSLRQIEIGVAGAKGTAIGSALAVASKRLKDLEAPDRVVILLTDGQNNAGRITPVQAAEAAAALDITVYTIGVGARRARTPWAGDGLDEKGLTQIAEMTGGKYFRATDTRSLQNIYAVIDQLEPSTAEVKEVVDFEEQFRQFLVPGLVLLALYLLLAHTWLRRGP
ncbi:MAG: VWA domain-containing protein [Alphaproteobacteria bacterium]|nr:VWA domain-containing protein [Alphaproteobacteria bacterium]